MEVPIKTKIISFKVEIKKDSTTDTAPLTLAIPRKHTNIVKKPFPENISHVL